MESTQAACVGSPVLTADGKIGVLVLVLEADHQGSEDMANAWVAAGQKLDYTGQLHALCGNLDVWSRPRETLIDPTASYPCPALNAE